MNKPILYLDMDNTLVCFQSGIDSLNATEKHNYRDRYDEHPKIFEMMQPLPDAVWAFNKLQDGFEVFILSTAPWGNPEAWRQKREWVERYLGESVTKRLILSHRKDLSIGDYLVDDRTANGAGEFTGELILFGSEHFNDWKTVVNYLEESLNEDINDI